MLRARAKIPVPSSVDRAIVKEQLRQVLADIEASIDAGSFIGLEIEVGCQKVAAGPDGYRRFAATPERTLTVRYGSR